MKQRLYCLKDIKINRAQAPFVCRDDNEAQIIISRAGFSTLVYQDLDLFFVGFFDDESCELELVSPIVRVGLCSQSEVVNNG